MPEDSLSITVLFDIDSADDLSDFAEIGKILQELPSEGVTVSKIPPPEKPKYKVPLTPDTKKEFLLERLRPEAYEAMGRAYGDLDGLTDEELNDLIIPFERGGGGPVHIADFLVQLLSIDPPTRAAIVAGVALIARDIINNYITRDRGRTLKLRHGENEIEISGHSVDEAEQILDEFFRRITNDILSK